MKTHILNLLHQQMLLLLLIFVDDCYNQYLKNNIERLLNQLSLFVFFSKQELLPIRCRCCTEYGITDIGNYMP